jgi:hypothetical protein
MGLYVLSSVSKMERFGDTILVIWYLKDLNLNLILSYGRPRYLKEGHCQEGQRGSLRERSCSIPPGMSCKPTEAEYKVRLELIESYVLFFITFFSHRSYYDGIVKIMIRQNGVDGFQYGKLKMTNKKT